MEQRKKESGIRLEDVAAGYGRKPLLNHISLHVSPGNVLTLIGPNGAGKSTILKTVTRQLAELGGTIFLDEIGNLTYEVQVQLLRALQERKVKPIGSNQEIAINVRLISATNENLRQAI